VEQNRDAQLHSLLVLETGIPKDRLRSVLAYGGFPLSAGNVVDGILSKMEEERTGRFVPVVRDGEMTCLQ
jgi:2-oxoglutarate/2-oxoacid ferredoxin oxidoreductase subunit alpha